MPSKYFDLKETKSDFYTQPIVLQNENGPCALLALVNNLVLQDTPMAAFINERLTHGAIVDETELLAKIGEIASQGNDEALEHLFNILPQLGSGLSINPRFNGTFTEIPLIFSFLNVKLYHGWVMGYDEVAELTGKYDQDSITPYLELNAVSYDEFCESTLGNNPNPIVKAFIERFQSQLTPTGYKYLQSVMNENEHAVLFWNNHFSTVIKRDNVLYSLATDFGLKQEGNIVWEKIDLSGAGEFRNANFEPVVIEQTKR